MNTHLESIKQMLAFNHVRNDVPVEEAPMEEHVDIDKLETLICLESLIITCYQTIGGMVHNRTIRHECQQFEKHAKYHQDELKKIFPLSQKSEAAIEGKVSQYLLQLKPTYLSLKEIINLISNFTAFKVDLYKHFSRTVHEHRDSLNSFLQDNIEEMYFLNQEKNFHQNRVNEYLKV